MKSKHFYVKIVSVINVKKFFIPIILCCVLLCSCANQDEISGFAMDAPYSIKVSGISKEKKAEIKEMLDNSNSIFNAYGDSFLYELNSEKKLIKTSENADLFNAVKLSLAYSDEFFDISVRPYTKLWDFNAENPVPPSEELLLKAKKSVGYENIIYSDNEIILRNDGEIELGAVAKGYMCDKAYEAAYGTEGIFDIGGTLKSSYNKPVSVGVRDPDGGVLCSFYINKGESVATSGSYERNFYYDGKLYHHILDPKTGVSADNNLLSVTVISDSAVKSDILSTKFFVSGIENADVPEGVTVIFADKNKKITLKGDKREIKNRR